MQPASPIDSAKQNLRIKDAFSVAQKVGNTVFIYEPAPRNQEEQGLLLTFAISVSRKQA
jgi:hypothetical protein